MAMVGYAQLIALKKDLVFSNHHHTATKGNA